MGSSDPIKVLKVFHEACLSQRGGEVVLRCGEYTGKVFFTGGRIAWVTVSTIKRTFADFLVEEASLDKEELQEVIEECKRSGKNFGETVVEWGLIDEDTLRALLKRQLSECLLEIFSWQTVENMFVPIDRLYKGSLTFQFDELLESVLVMDQAKRLPFAGTAHSELMKILHKEREKTIPYLPAFSEESTEQAPEREPTDASATRPPVESLPSVVLESEQAVEKNPGRKLFIVIVLSALALACLMGYLLRDRIKALFSGDDAPQLEQPQAAPEQPAVASADAGALQDAGTSGGEEASLDAGVSDAGREEQGPQGIVAFAESPQVGSLQVISKPSRARIYLDGVYTGKRTPATLSDLTAGLDHVILVEHRRRKPAFVRVRLEPEEKRVVNLKLKRRDKRFRGRIRVTVESDPEGALLEVNGRKVDKPTPTEVQLPADRTSKLKLQQAGFRSLVLTVRPVPGVELTLRPKLKKK